MRLIDAGGDGRMGRALANSYVQTIVDILIEYPRLLTLVADLLQTYTRHGEAGLEDELKGLVFSQRDLKASGETFPEHVTRLAAAIRGLYQQSNEQIRILRGAIVELLAYKLVYPRYKPGECLSNQRFLDGEGRPVTDQIDVAAISRDRSEIEGYECKIKVDGVESSDCTGLAFLFNTSGNWGYRANVGVVTFDEVRVMSRRLQRLNPAAFIKLYGLDSLFALQYTPFV